jgi:hypothetical protein
LLDGSPVIRLDIKNLENLQTVIKHPDYTFTADQLSELSTTIKNSNSKARLIEQLSYATKYADDYPQANSILGLAKVGPIDPVRSITGSNGKIAIIGRKMSLVKVYRDELKALGKDVEIFEGEVIPLAAREELKIAQKTGEWLDETSEIYKANEIWANKLKVEKYEIQDIGNPYQQGESMFYKMEKQIIFGD